MARYENAEAANINALADMVDNVAKLQREHWTIDQTPRLGTKEFLYLSDFEFTDKRDPAQQTKIYDRIRKNMRRMDRVNLIRDAWNRIQDRKNEFELQPAPIESRGFTLLPQSRAFHIIALDNRRYL